MDEDSLPPPLPPPPPLLSDETNASIIPYLFTPCDLLPSSAMSLMNQYYQTHSSILDQQTTLPTTHNSQFDLDNFEWVSAILSGNSITNGIDGDNQMIATRNNYVNISTEGGGDENYSSQNKRKAAGKSRSNKKYVPPRVAFHTRSTEDILDDGYKWRKYGQKAVKHTKHPRSYYRCTHHTCNVKKQIQRLSKDNSVVVTTYEGIHNHPCEKLMETLSPLLRQLQFLSRF